MLVCLTGAELPLGQVISRRLQAQGITVETVDNALFSENASVLHKHFASLTPAHYIIHAAEFDWQQAEVNPEKTRIIILESCPVIIKYAELWDAPVIFLSSFMVFDGTKNNPYISANSGQPLNVYGHAKLAAENYFLENYPKSLIIRLGWLLDAGKDSWFSKVLKRFLEGDAVTAYTDVEISPTAIEDVARVVEAILKQLACEISVWGLYHYAGTEPVSHETLVKSIRYQALGQELLETQIISTKFHFSDIQVELPKNGVLGCVKLRNTFGIKQLPWRRYLPMLIEQYYSNNSQIAE